MEIIKKLGTKKKPQRHLQQMPLRPLYLRLTITEHLSSVIKAINPICFVMLHALDQDFG